MRQHCNDWRRGTQVPAHRAAAWCSGAPASLSTLHVGASNLGGREEGVQREKTREWATVAESSRTADPKRLTDQTVSARLAAVCPWFGEAAPDVSGVWRAVDVLPRNSIHAIRTPTRLRREHHRHVATIARWISKPSPRSVSLLMVGGASTHAQKHLAHRINTVNEVPPTASGPADVR